MHITVSHNQTIDIALKKIKTRIEKAKKEYPMHVHDLREQWTSNTLNLSFIINKMRINAKLLCSETSVVCILQLPLALAFFKGRIQKMIYEEINSALS